MRVSCERDLDRAKNSGFWDFPDHQGVKQKRPPHQFLVEILAAMLGCTGQEVDGSMVSRWVISPQYIPFTNRRNNPLIRSPLIHPLPGHRDDPSRPPAVRSSEVGKIFLPETKPASGKPHWKMDQVARQIFLFEAKVAVFFSGVKVLLVLGTVNFT